MRRPELPAARFVTAPRIVVLVAAAAIGGLLALSVRAGDDTSRAAWHERLDLVLAERDRQFDVWLRERTNDTRVLAATPIVRQSVVAPAADPQTREPPVALQRHLARFCSTYGYADAAVVDAAGLFVASCSGFAPEPATIQWAMRAGDDDEEPAMETLESAEGLALRFAAAIPSENHPPGTALDPRQSGALVLTTPPLSSVDDLILPRIGGTRTGRVTLRPSAPDTADDATEIRAAHPVLGGARFLVATIAAGEALATARAAALSQGLIASGAILLPLLLAVLGWQRERARALRAALRQQDALLEARAYADAIVQSIDAVVWEAEGDEATVAATPADVAHWRFTFVSRRVEAILGHPTEAWLGCGNLWVDHVAPEDRARVARFYAGVPADTARAGSVEFRAQRADGSEVWLSDRVVATTLDGRTRRIRGVLVDVTLRVRAEQDAAALLAVARDAGAAVDRAELLARVQRRTAEVLPCDRVVTFLRDPARDVLRVAAHHGLRPERVAAIEALEFHAGQPLGGRVLAGETVVLNDVESQPWLPAALYESFGVTALVAAPLHLGGAPSGALVAFATVPSRAPFETRQATLLEGIARQLAVGLEVAEYHEGQKDEAAVVSSLERVGRELINVRPDPVTLLEQLCHLTMDILSSDVGCTLLQRPGEETLTLAASDGIPAEQRAALEAVRLPHELAARILDTTAAQGLLTLRPEDPSVPAAGLLCAALGVETLLCVPLRRDGHPAGIHCAGYRAPQAVPPRLQRIARGLGEIASTVFERVQLVAELERASRVRSDFIATMSHELRTPLHIITGYQEILLDGAGSALTTEQRGMLERCQHNARTLLELVNATLDLTRLEAGYDPPLRAPVNVPEVVDAAVADLAEMARGPEVTLVVQHPPAPPELATDPVKLKVIVKNLVGNAIKFTDRGSVTVRTSAVDDGVEVSVTDSGIGIPSDALDLIFEPFRQVDGSNTRRHGGVGLGLHIVQRLVDTLGGSISVESSPGCGSTFRLRLPQLVARADASGAS